MLQHKQIQQLPDIDINRVIGSGCFGVVLQGYYKNTNKKFALKRILKVANQLSREYDILNMIKDLDNVVHMEHFFYTKDESGSKLIQNIIFEFVQSNLQNLIEQTQKSRSSIKQLTIKKFAYQLLNGLKNIHHYNIAHRDLKPQNVLLSDNGEIKICDFGSSKIISPDGKNTPYIVSRYYRAPELILCMTNYSTAIDIWAAGCIIAELYTLVPFFRGKTQGEQIFSITKRLGGFSQAEKKFYKQKVSYQIDMLGVFDEFSRQDLRETFKMSKDKDNLIDLLEKMFQYNPNQRITAKQALNHAYFNDVRTEFIKTKK